ncbi:hypothetical protein JVU11DRAFT_4081 [Chiua virens]|nr:hypothetical protein JVU11DRAFT_4081 [Chiua virens]
MDVDVDESRFAKAFDCAPIYDSIFSRISLYALVQLALTCRVTHLAVAEYKTRAFSINRHLSRYFSDPIAFRSLQAKTNTLISGSNALQFLDRSFYPESDLDLYTHPGHSFEVAQFLVETEGYKFVPSSHRRKDWREAIRNNWNGTVRRIRKNLDNKIYPLEGIKHVFTFQKIGTSEQETLKIQVIETTASPVEAILSFHSSELFS